MGVGFPPGDVHVDGAHVLFCDGSVRWHLRKEIMDVGADTPGSTRMRRMWFYDNEPN